MAYGADSDVLGLVPILNSVTYPTSTIRGNWLDRISAVMNLKLAASDYTVPVTSASTTDYPALVHYCTIKVASMAIRVATLGAEWEEKAQAWEEEFESMFPSDDNKSNLVLSDQTSPISSKTGVLQFARHNRRGEY